MNFDNQADSYDARIKLPAHLPKAIAEMLATYVPLTKEHKLLEVGVGTGEISAEIVKTVANYTGFDKSASMVDLFIKRYSEKDKLPNVVVADGNELWPVEKGNTDVVFSSKALHLLDNRHVLNELKRIKGINGLTLVIGSMKKDPSGIDSQMRKRMQKMLAGHGVDSKGGEMQRKKFYEQCVEAGGKLLAPLVVAQWDVQHSANDSIDSWKNVEGLAGNMINDKTKSEIIIGLENWAMERFGSLSKKIQSYRQYKFSGVFFKN